MELMIVVAIAGIIAGIALPSYLDSVRKGRRSDARTSLVEAVAMQERIFSETRSYVPNAELDRLVVNGDGVSSRDGYYMLSVSTAACAGPPYSCYSITATAQGGQTSDTNCATFTVNHIGQKTSLPNTEVCW